MGGVVGETPWPRRPPTPKASGLTEAQRNSEALRVALASLVGSTIEWYDFFLYGTAAALVFRELFFPIFDLVGTLLSFSTMAVGYIARPLGAIVMGHFGDKLGRKAMLITSLVMMGLATTLIGVLPSFQRIGVTAPLILISARLLQGFAVGGEVGGAITMAVEHAPEQARSFRWVPTTRCSYRPLLRISFSWRQVFPERRGFQIYGWRIPFLVSILLVLIGVYVRLKVARARSSSA